MMRSRSRTHFKHECAGQDRCAGPEGKNQVTEGKVLHNPKKKRTLARLSVSAINQERHTIALFDRIQKVAECSTQRVGTHADILAACGEEPGHSPGGMVECHCVHGPAQVLHTITTQLPRPDVSGRNDEAPVRANFGQVRAQRLHVAALEDLVGFEKRQLEEQHYTVRELVDDPPRDEAPLGGGPVGMNEGQVVLQEAPDARAHPAKDLGQGRGNRTAQPFRRETAAECAKMIWEGLQH